jgi:dCTP diphosphatase
MREDIMELDKIQSYLDNFAKNRNWEKYRTPKNLAMALSVEVAELVEIFQWMDGQESVSIRNDEKTMQDIKEELADILSYLVQIASVLSIDLNQAFWEKTKKNEKKYPINLTISQ